MQKRAYMTRFIFVAGGVISGVGKGVATASLGKIIKEHGYTTTLIKIDPYINYDAGTLRPTEHGEVWVTDDGGEIDQDLGTYERFLDQDIPKQNNITTGQIYKAVIDRERRGDYLGQTVQFIPHIVDEVKQRIIKAAQGYEVAIIEMGGTVGDYENIPYMFAMKAIEREFGKESAAYILVTYLPIPNHIHEMKTKPTHQAIRLLGQEGISPDFILCRSQYPLDDVRKKKIEVVANINADRIISAPDLESIYQMPLNLEKEKLGEKILAHFGLPSLKTPDLTSWKQLVAAIASPVKKITIAIVGKYLDLGDYSLIDSYVSIYQAIAHAGAQLNIGADITWINAVDFEKNPEQLHKLAHFNGIIVPGGFGQAGVEGKIAAIEYARKHNIPYLGLCYGMQLAVVEFARNVVGLTGAHTTEVNPQANHPVIDLIAEQRKTLAESDYGGTMRLGSYKAAIKPGSVVASLYEECGRVIRDNDTVFVSERHRHRYEVNPLYVVQIEDHGALFSGCYQRADGTTLMEFFELPEHRFFVATQAHPEFKSRLGNSSPLFFGFMRAAAAYEPTDKQQKQEDNLFAMPKALELSL